MSSALHASIDFCDVKEAHTSQTSDNEKSDNEGKLPQAGENASVSTAMLSHFLDTKQSGKVLAILVIWILDNSSPELLALSSTFFSFNCVEAFLPLLEIFMFEIISQYLFLSFAEFWLLTAFYL